MKSKSNLLNRFKHELEALCNTIECDCGYNPIFLRSFISKPYVVNVVSRIVGKPSSSKTFDILKDMGRLDLSLEAFILRDNEFETLFRNDIIKICEARLARAGYLQLPDKAATSEGLKRVVIVRRKKIAS